MKCEAYVTVYAGGNHFVSNVPPATPQGGITYRVEFDPVVHGTAIIDPLVEIGEGTKIWHWVHVMGPTVIGRDCMLGQSVFVADLVKIGDRVRIQNHTNVSRYVTIEDDVFVGSGVQFCNSAHPIPGQDPEPQCITVRRGASIGSNACLVGGVEIGENAVVGAGAVVTHDVPANTTVMGMPARPR